MKQKRGDLETLAVSRREVADADKVRYRVYSTPTEFIAVIAESALMAVKVSGVTKPHRIVRDLPTEGISIEAKRMAAIPDTPLEKVSFTMAATQGAVKERLTVKDFKPLQPAEVQAQGRFQPMRIGDLQVNTLGKARILPPELLTQIIEDHVRAHMPAAVAQAVADVVDPAPEPVSVAPAPAQPTPPSPEELVKQLAAEMDLPSAKEGAPAAPAQGGNLTPEEVQRLLNE